MLSTEFYIGYSFLCSYGGKLNELETSFFAQIDLQQNMNGGKIGRRAEREEEFGRCECDKRGLVKLTVPQL